MPDIQRHKEDFALYRRHLAGQPDSSARLYDRAYPLLCRFVKCQAGNSILSVQDMEEVISETIFVAFYEASFDGGSLFSTWVCGIARNKLFNAYKKKQAYIKRHCDWNDYCELNANPLDIIIKKELFEAVAASMNALPTRLCVLLILSVIEQKSPKEITDIFGISRKDYFEQYSKAIDLLQYHFIKNYYSL